MPFDIPEFLDFDVAFEDTRMADKKYVINQTTGEPLGIVGKSSSVHHMEISFVVSLTLQRKP